MKKLVFSVLSVFALFPFFAWAITGEDLTVANKILRTILADSNNGNDRSSLVEWYYIVDDAIDEQWSWSIHNRLLFVKNELRVFIDGMKAADVVWKEIVEKKFLTSIGSGVTFVGDDLPQSCFEHAWLVDDLAWSEDLSPAMVIGVWKMEASCRMYYPHNGDGPFQILSKNVTGDMTVPKFVNEFQDFAAFSRNKRNWYARANKKSNLSVDLSYDSLDITWIVRHGALYNGLSGASIRWNIQPANANYVWGRYSADYSDANKDGLVVVILKFLSWK